MTRYVNNEKDLKSAYNAGAKEIVVTGKLAKSLKNAKGLAHATPAVIALIGAAVATFAGATATAPFTGGTSYLAAAPALFAEAATVSSALSISTASAVSLIILASTIGLSMLIGIFRDYSVDFSVKHGETECRLSLKRN